MDVLTDLDFRGRHLSYQRGRHTTHSKTSLIKIEGVDDTPAAKYVSASTQHDDVRKPLLTVVLASTLARRLPMSTGDRRRSVAPRSA